MTGQETVSARLSRRTMTKSGGKKLNCQISVRVDGVFKSFSLSKRVGMKDLEAAEELFKVLKLAAFAWLNGEK